MIVKCIRGGPKATAQVWDNPTGLEWTVPSPAPHHTFDEPPVDQMTRRGATPSTPEPRSAATARDAARAAKVRRNAWLLGGLAAVLLCRLHGVDVRPRERRAERDERLARSPSRSGRSPASASRCSRSASRSCRSTTCSARSRGSAARRRRRPSRSSSARSEPHRHASSSSRRSRAARRSARARGQPHRSASGPALRDALPRAQSHGLDARRAGRAERRARRRGALFQQGRVLLLHEPGVRSRTRSSTLKLAFMVAPELPAHVDTLSLSYTYFSASN